MREEKQEGSKGWLWERLESVSLWDDSIPTEPPTPFTVQPPSVGICSTDQPVTWESLCVTARTISVCDNHTERRGFYQRRGWLPVNRQLDLRVTLRWAQQIFSSVALRTGAEQDGGETWKLLRPGVVIGFLFLVTCQHSRFSSSFSSNHRRGKSWCAILCFYLLTLGSKKKNKVFAVKDRQQDDEGQGTMLRNDTLVCVRQQSSIVIQRRVPCWSSMMWLKSAAGWFSRMWNKSKPIL